MAQTSNPTRSASGAGLVLLSSVVAANALTDRFGLVPVGFGLLVTAGTFTAGVALVARDYVHEYGGLRAVLATVAAAGVVSWLIADPRIALASTVALVVSELADTMVYAPLRSRRWRMAVLASSAVGALADTALFLSLAFGLSALTGQAIGGQLLVKVGLVAVPVALVGGYLRGRRAVSVRD